MSKETYVAFSPDESSERTFVVQRSWDVQTLQMPDQTARKVALGLAGGNAALVHELSVMPHSADLVVQNYEGQFDGVTSTQMPPIEQPPIEI